MRVLVTGATGFVGRRVCEVLDAAGHEVLGLSRDADAARRKVSQLRRAFSWNPTAGPPPEEALAESEAVVHLAGESVAGRWNQRTRRAIRDSRVLGTRHLVTALHDPRPRPRVLVSASAIGYYGDRGEEELREDSAPGHDFLAEVCQGWEAEAARATASEVRVVRLRIGVVLGPGGGALEAMLPPFKVGAGGPLGSGRQYWSWIHRDDVAGVVRLALENGDLQGAYNVTAPEPVPQREFAKVLGKVLGRPAFLPTPALALKIVLGGFSSELLASKRVLPHRLRDLGYEFRYPELEAALRQSLGR